MPAKKKLLVILGAGSSAEQGFPIASDLDGEVRQWARDYVKRLGRDPIESLSAQTHADYFNLLWSNRENYSADLSSELKSFTEPRTAPNYERVLGDLHVLMNAVLAKPYGDPIFKWIPQADVFASLKIRPDSTDLDGHASGKVFHAIQGQLHYLCARIATRIRDCSRRFELELENDRGTAAFNPYQRLLTTLTEQFSVGVYNLNHDTVALNALPNAFVGFDRQRGAFQPTQILSRKQWDFLYHLHGSVHHRIRVGSREQEHDDFGLKVVWHDDLSQTGDGEDWEDIKDVRLAADGKRILPTSLVTGGLKLDQLQEEPFLTLYSVLTHHAYQADAILIGGYGFADPHINAVIHQVLRSKAVGRRRPPVLVVTRRLQGAPTAKRHDPWINALGQTLRVPPVTFRAPEHLAQRQWTELPETMTTAGFERSMHAPVAIWNGGFQTAETRLEDIVKWLRGESHALDHGVRKSTRRVK
jgi:hypothetical protein